MVDERELRSKFRHALDEVLPPAPWLEAAVAEDLRRRLPKTSLRSPRRDFSLPRRSMALVAGLLVVALAAAGAITFVNLRYSAPHSEPAGSVTVQSYQTMIALDSSRWATAGNPYYSCADLQSPCEAPGHPVRAALQRWLDDLNRSTPPARFAVVDLQLRRHLAADIADMNAMFAAYPAQDEAALDRARYAMSTQEAWLSGIASSVVDSQQVTVAKYASEVQAQRQSLDACASCAALAGDTQPDCLSIQSASCQSDVDLATTAIERFEAMLVRDAAPAAMGDQDLRLQLDLAQADTAVLTMSSAQALNDQAAFNTGHVSLKQALAAIDTDVASITGG